MIIKKYTHFFLGLLFVFTLNGYPIQLAKYEPVADFGNLKQAILSNPEAIVTTTHTLSHEGRKIKNPTEFNRWLVQAEQECPIALMSECTSTKCGLSRVQGQGHKRAQFDDYASTRLLQVQNSSGFANYGSLASGGGFNDARILTLAYEKGLRQVAVHLIDPSYGSCITALKNLRTYDISALASTKEYYRAHSIREFIRYLTQLFGENNIKFYFYTSGQEYLETIKITGAHAPDILVGIDFDPGKKVYNACLHDFIKITEKTSTQALHVTGAGIFHLYDKNRAVSVDLPNSSHGNKFGSKLKSHFLRF